MPEATPTPRRAPATQQDVADLARVSRGLVSLALKGEGRMSAKTRQRITDAARTLHYRPNSAAAELASRRSRRLAVIVPYLDNPFFDLLLRALRRHASQAGYVLAAFVSDLTDRVERSTIDDVLSMRPEGLILPGTSMSLAELIELAAQIPLVVMDRHLHADTLNVVRLDEDDAAGQIIEHLTSQQVKDLVFFSPSESMHETLVDERREACRAAATRAGMSFTSLVCNDGATPALEQARTVVGGRFGAVAYNDVLALDLHTALLTAGLRPGHDVALVSYDNSPWADRSEFRLTSIDQSPDLLASECVEILLRDPDAPPAHREVAASLVVRASSLPSASY
ncbi:LacI family DNA-binding transcriptional regulator [Actinomyces faecalis]|uniref:LacI family DNA-binding transcriptional regulator n=1 Tax=Actinomyces faecalis TaxID=2722820 RepID=UPI001551CE8F|nr:LacI family DNA-binding transcriptional regulator [Actinomyces faecalis]